MDIFLCGWLSPNDIRLVDWLTSGREKINIYHFKLISSNPIVIGKQKHYVYNKIHDTNSGLMSDLLGNRDKQSSGC